MVLDKNNRILVAGAGALGTVLGGFLRKSGFDVALLGRVRHMSAIEKDGLKVEGIWGEHLVSGLRLASCPGELGGTYDFVLVTVKSYDTEAVIRDVIPFTSENTVFVSLQNGLGNVEKISRLAGEDKTGGARVIFGSELLDYGRVKVTVYADPVMIGPLAPGIYPRLESRLAQLVQGMDSSGIPTLLTDDIHGYLWAKLFYNCALNPLGAILKVTYGALSENRHTKSIMDSVIDEVFCVARKKGIKLFWSEPGEYKKLFYGKLVPATYGHRSSMLQDLDRGKKTEIDAMTGKVCEYGLAAGVATPVNDVLYNIVSCMSR